MKWKPKRNDDENLETHDWILWRADKISLALVSLDNSRKDTIDDVIAVFSFISFGDIQLPMLFLRQSLSFVYFTFAFIEPDSKYSTFLFVWHTRSLYSQGKKMSVVSKMMLFQIVCDREL